MVHTHSPVQRRFADKPSPGWTTAITIAVVATFISAGLVIGGPGALAETDQNRDAGRLVHAFDPDVALEYTSSLAAACFIDMDGSGSYGADDSVVLTFQGSCSGQSGPSDLRLAEWGGHPAGRLLSTAPDQGQTLVSPNPEPQFWYYDADGSNRLTPGDTVYLKIREANQGLVRTNDVRITPFEDHLAGSRVLIGDADHQRSLNLLGTANERVRHVDVLTTNTFSVEDFIYLSRDTQRSVAGSGDVRLFSPTVYGLSFGKILDDNDPDGKSLVRPTDRPLCYVDRDETGDYHSGDTLYLSIAPECTGAVALGDIRISSGPDGEAGSRVAEGDPDQGSAYGALAATRLGYIDQDGDGRLSQGDLVFANIFSASEDRVHAGDLLLTPTERGTGVVIEPGDPLVGTSLINLGLFREHVAFAPFGTATSPTRHDPFFLSPGTTVEGGLRPGDVRLQPLDDHPYGGPVGFATGEILAEITRGHGAVCSSSSIPQATDDTVYLRLDGSCPSHVQAGLLRLTPFAQHQSFTTVRPGDSDHGTSLTTVSGPLHVKFHDADGNNRYSAGDTLYLDIRDPGNNQVRVADVRLTPFGEHDAGDFVRSGDSDLGGTLTNLGAIAQLAGYVDMERDNQFGARDHAYITPAPTLQYVSPLSARLTPLPVAFVAPGIPDDPGSIDPDPMPSPTPTPTPSPGATPTPTPDPSGDEEEPTPGPALFFVLFALTGLVIWARARRC